jgi:hypothetical protein
LLSIDRYRRRYDIFRMLKRSPFITPTAAVLRPAPPSGHGWLHEVKFDGWRAQLHKSGDDVVIFSRNGADYTRRFRAVRDSMLRIALSQYSAAHADPEECQEAVERYNTAIQDIADRMKRYSRCLSDSAGNDDCSSEFRKLKSAQDDYEYAVNEYRSECS